MVVLFVSAGLVRRLVNELNVVAKIVVDYAGGAFRALLARLPRAFVH